ncbi:hypothetical protein T484DRAFT_1975506 [Baffinella frigidus]|nr:hypothetical protein T484DRAFT_1975506 [Cryptophyta sp. CCMP2293]
MSGIPGSFNPSVKRLFKDCLRMVKHVAEEHKAVDQQQVILLVRQQFMANAHVTNPEKLSSLKGNAMSALTNYVMYISKSKAGI